MTHANSEEEVLEREAIALRQKLTEAVNQLMSKLKEGGSAGSWVRSHPLATVGAGVAGGVVAGSLLKGRAFRVLRPLLPTVLNVAKRVGLPLLMFAKSAAPEPVNGSSKHRID